MHSYFSHNMCTVDFWLAFCVLPQVICVGKCPLFLSSVPWLFQANCAFDLCHNHEVQALSHSNIPPLTYDHIHCISGQKNNSCHIFKSSLLIKNLFGTVSCRSPRCTPHAWPPQPGTLQTTTTLLASQVCAAILDSSRDLLLLLFLPKQSW